MVTLAMHRRKKSREAVCRSEEPYPKTEADRLRAIEDECAILSHSLLAAIQAVKRINDDVRRELDRVRG